MGDGLNDLISCLMLWCGFLKYSHCQMIIYVLSCLVDAFRLGVAIGFWAQVNRLNRDGGSVTPAGGISATKSKELSFEGDGANALIVITFLLFTFYTVAIVLAFRGYKEFKGAM